MDQIIGNLDTWVKIETGLDPEKTYGYLLHDYELDGWWGEDRRGKTRWFPRKHGDPETVATYLKEDRVSLSPAWQAFHKLLFVLAAFGVPDMSLFPEVERGFESTLEANRVITNNRGFPEGYMPLCLGGNVVELMTPIIERPGGFGPAYRIKCLDGSKSPPDVEDIFWNHPELWSKATIARYAYPEDNSGLVNPWSHVIPFPQLDRWNAHVPLLNISNIGYNWVPVKRVQLMAFNTVRNPYNPPLQKRFG